MGTRKASIPCKPVLKCREDGSFRILMLSDMHAGVGYNAEDTVRAMDTMLEALAPDFVMLGGDVIGPGVIHVENSAELWEVLSTLVSPMETRGIPWAHVFGNHDDNFGLPNREAMKVYQTWPCCLSENGPEELPGSGNYSLPVYDPAGGKPIFRVWGMDSHRSLENFPMGRPGEENAWPGRRGEDAIRPSQVEWYYRTSREFELAGRKTPGVLFTHTPLPEHAILPAHPEETGMVGICDEEVSCPKLNTGLFSALLERGDILGVFTGHDHDNNFAGRYFGIWLGYDGYLSYHASHREDLRGGRVIDWNAGKPEELSTRFVALRDI